jgi:FKBP-type peptidyl-prolyl cis-trans isomerase
MKKTVFSILLLLGITSKMLVAQTFDKTWVDVKTGLKYKTLKGSKIANAGMLKENDNVPSEVKLFNQKGELLNNFGFNPQTQIAKQMWGYLLDGIVKTKLGDSTIFAVVADSLFGKQLPPGIVAGDYVNLTVVTYDQNEITKRKSMVTLKNEADLKKFFADNKLNPIRTNEGLYYVITQEGTGPLANAGQKVVVNYTGKLLDGSVFDSNVLPENGHVEPFEFSLGSHGVIEGWEIGFSKIKKGSKATLYIPSNLGYGERGAPGGKIKPNDCLIFDIELLDIK